VTAEDTIQQLRVGLRGEVIVPADPDYDQARAVFLTGIDRRPAAVARVADADDAAIVVSIAREAGLELAVRSGGHSNAGHGTSEGGIVLDLSRLRALEIDSDRGAAWAETGLTAGEYTAATGAHGLVTGLGDTGSVGLGGITLSGGIGYLVRRSGLTIDNLLGAELVMADGSLLRVDEESEPDLFWAIRGGGGNFGVATRLRFRLDEISNVFGGMLMLPATPEVIASFVAAADAAPEQLSAIANVMLAPPMPFVPAEHQGRPVLLALMAFTGAAEAGERAIAPFRALATPIADMLRPMRYPELYEGPEGPKPVAAATRTMFVDSVDRDRAEEILDHIETSTAPRAAAQLRVLGGAMARVPQGATAFAHRDRRVMVYLAAMYEDPDEARVHQDWVGGFADALRDGRPGAYVGFLGDEDEATVREAYGEPTWDRLASIKARYDPTNLFRLNQNLPPAR
jgi:FAD/FMN-containing dehydrogenase